MLCYLNRGFILEQAIANILKEYLETIRLEESFPSFHINVSNEHPFAKMFLNDGMNASDTFPAIVVTTGEDDKPADFVDLQPNYVDAIAIDENDLSEIIPTSDDRAICTAVSESALQAIKDSIALRGACYGYSVRTRRQDKINIEIWAENSQLKNELYEQIRLFVLSNLSKVLDEKYPFFATALFDNTIQGQRSNNYNFDFDVELYGAHIGFEVHYCIEQIVLDTSATQINEIDFTGGNYVFSTHA